jgi:long-chain acyl-CoA synthetase
MFGTVGPLLPGVEVKLAEDGEILCKGPNVMMGYYKRPDLTAEVLADGWFHTGDIGILVDGKYLKITDRKKEMFKTSGGKFVGALIVPAFTNLRNWCRQNGIPDASNEELIRHPRVVELYHEIVESYNKYFSHVEQIKRFVLLPAEWSIETGEMTPKLSLKRKVITEKYRDAIEKIYSENRGG